MIVLRKYQEAAKAAVYDHLRTRNDNPCVVIPTAGGKTPVMASICKDAVTTWGGRVLVLAHVKELLEQAADKLESLGYFNVHVKVGDGFFGWPEHAPFDAIIVTAAGIEVPPALIDQLKPEGKLVIPVGEQNAVQHLLVLTKHEDGSVSQKNILPVRFVPITGQH